MRRRDRCLGRLSVFSTLTEARIALIVAVVVAVYALIVGSAGRGKLREATSDVIVSRCQSENVLRGELRDLVRAGQDNLKAYHARGLLTDREYRETLKDQDDALAKMAARPCRKMATQFERRAH